MEAARKAEAAGTSVCREAKEKRDALGKVQEARGVELNSAVVACEVK